MARRYVAAVLAAVAFLTAHWSSGASAGRSEPVFALQVSARAGASPATSHEVAAELRRVHAGIGRDFDVFPRRLDVETFGTHAAFAHALWVRQRARPQSDTDASGSIVHGTLLLGPMEDAYLRHNLAHVYTEWLIDHLTDNFSDALPGEPWLYDGIAEYEAYRYVPHTLTCSGAVTGLLDVRSIHTAQEWLRIRAGPLGSVEYCMAFLRVRAMVRRAGWSCVVAALRDPRGWKGAAARLLAVDRGAICTITTSQSSHRR